MIPCLAWILVTGCFVFQQISSDFLGPDRWRCVTNNAQTSGQLQELHKELSATVSTQRHVTHSATFNVSSPLVPCATTGTLRHHWYPAPPLIPCATIGTLRHHWYPAPPLVPCATIGTLRHRIQRRHILRHQRKTASSIHRARLLRPTD